jgi:hypothetical protein
MHDFEPRTMLLDHRMVAVCDLVRPSSSDASDRIIVSDVPEERSAYDDSVSL